MPRSTVLVLLPHKKKKTTFKEFGGTLSGHMNDSLEEYGDYIYWVWGVPGTKMKTGWSASRPAAADIAAWKDYVTTHNPEVFGRSVLGYDEASELFDAYTERYNK